MKKKKKVIIILLIVVIGVIGFTIAYFSNQVEFENIFETKSYKTRVKEEFVSPDNWLPGDTTPKVLSVQNTGDIDQAVRVSYTEEWVAKDGTTILSNWIDENGNGTTPTSNTSSDEKVAIINFLNEKDWTKENGYFYYNYKLAPGEETSQLLDSVTFNDKVKANVTCGNKKIENGETIIDCEAANTGYADATYKLTFKIDTAQYENYRDVWNTDIYIVNGRQELKGIITNPLNTEYNEYTKGRMFTFEHEATEQTPALTDYRYIGDDPDNYVYFNCDDEEDTSTCEIWRIIGVFDVDDGTGNYETRIKLLRGYQFKESMYWNSNGSNDWNEATLQYFLNGDYYNRTGRASEYGLKESARDMIGNAKYYLGTIGYFDYSTIETGYQLERGSTGFNPENSWECNNQVQSSGLCTIKPGSWTGKIGLMNPSDYKFVYSNGVDIYFGRDIHSGNYISTYSEYRPDYHPERRVIKNWIFNSQLTESNFVRRHLSWLISPGYGPNEVYHIDSTLMRNDGEVDDLYDFGFYSQSREAFVGVRPVVYLNKNISVISGDGSSSNPYHLGIVSQSNKVYGQDIEYSSYKVGDEITYDGNQYYVLNDSNNKKKYVTLLKKDLLTANEVNQYVSDYDSQNGEYHFFENSDCRFVRINQYSTVHYMSGCIMDYSKSNIKRLIDNWSMKYDEDLIEVNGYKARLLIIDELFDNLGYEINYYGTNNSYRAGLDSPEWAYIGGSPYWTMSVSDNTEHVIYTVDNYIWQYYVNSKVYVRPVINLNKCAIENGCTKY